jgi:hypothetical protein
MQANQKCFCLGRLNRMALTVWLQALHGIRDNRINELARLGYRVAGLTAWCGNSVTPPKVHYNAGGSLQRWGFVTTLRFISGRGVITERRLV